MYLYETHMHTREGSFCSQTGGEQQAIYYKKLGYDGIFITDHFFNGNSTINQYFRDESWEVRVCEFCKGFENAKKMGDEIGLKVFFGFEFNFHGTEWLIYGLSKEWLISHPEIMELDPKSFLRLVHKSGGYAIQAHPFREAEYIDTIRILPYEIDGMEVFNAKNIDRANEVARLYADLQGIPVTCGSDCHNDRDKNLCAMGCECEISSADEFIEKLKNNQLKLLKMKGDSFYEL